VREEFNRADALENDKRAGTVGFALTILQRRLASSPEAIAQSLRRRRERLEGRMSELELLQRGAAAAPIMPATAPALDAEDVEDLEDAPDNEVEAAEEEILDQATAARTIAELKAEIETLKRLETLALAVRRSGDDTKWRQLANLLSEIFTPAAIANELAEEGAPYDAGTIEPPKASPSQKLVIFTEHRDTLNYLRQRMSTLLGRPEAIVCIHGGIGREERMRAWWCSGSIIPTAKNPATPPRPQPQQFSRAGEIHLVCSAIRLCLPPWTRCASRTWMKRFGAISLGNPSWKSAKRSISIRTRRGRPRRSWRQRTVP
jgi:hypothetical protein